MCVGKEIILTFFCFLVAGKTYGLAKEAGLVAVKVLGASGSGSTAGVIEGVDFSVSDCDGKHQTNKCVINMSLSGSGSRVMDGAVEGAVEAGVYVVVAAGNSNDDSCNYSPARSDAVMTVMASVEPPAGQSDKRATYSNYGPCVDITAPGSSITSAWSTSDTAINTISGTSMVRHFLFFQSRFDLRSFLSSNFFIPKLIFIFFLSRPPLMWQERRAFSDLKEISHLHKLLLLWRVIINLSTVLSRIAFWLEHQSCARGLLPPFCRPLVNKYLVFWDL